MNEEKSDQEKRPASPSPETDTTPTTDPMVVENKSSTETESQPDQPSVPAVENESIDAESMDAESMDAESVAAESVTDTVNETVAESVAETADLDATQKSPESTQTEEQMEVDPMQPAVGSSTPEDELLSNELADKLAEVTRTDLEPTGVDNLSPDNDSEVAGKEAINTAPLTTENLLSVLEDLPDRESSDMVENAESVPESGPQAAAAQSQANTEDATSKSQSQSTPAQSQSTTSAEKQSEEAAAKRKAAAPSAQTQAEAPPSASQPVSTPDGQPESSGKAQQSASELPPPKSSRKYVYKLRSKSGKVLQYTSSVPITLKKPVITLVKMDEGEDDNNEGAKSAVPRKATRTEAEEVDSDNSTKENNVKANDASTPGTGPRIARKRGRPPLSQKTPVITHDDHHTPDVASNSKDTFKSAAAGSSTSTAATYGMQTRKRQLKFLPDGRIVAPAGKKYKSAAAVSAAVSSAKAAREENPSSDSDVLTDSDSGSQSDRKTKKPPQAVVPATKKIAPPERKVGVEKPGIKKVFDYESLFRERSGMPSTTPSGGKTPSIIKKVVETPKSAAAKPFNAGRNLMPSSSKSTPTPSSSPATPTSANKNQVDPAQLLSSLIGVTILAHQLNVVKFKPKVIQDRKTVSAQKNVTFVDDSSKSSNKKSLSVTGQKETQSQTILPSQRSASFRPTPRTQLQRILPKPLPSDRTSTPIRKVMELPKAAAVPLLASPRITPVTTPIAASRLGVLQSKLGVALTSPVSPAFSGPSHRVGPAGDAPRFENFTDTKVVRTKEGPRKSQSQRSGDAPAAGSKDKEEVQTVYELARSLFEQIPSWNLHIMPDSNSFCIAQVSRGRMGIPILKKSIELNTDFTAKVYVHQLHCKKYDGIYDTQSKILSLIREIDALAA